MNGKHTACRHLQFRKFHKDRNALALLIHRECITPESGFSSNHHLSSLRTLQPSHPMWCFACSLLTHRRRKTDNDLLRHTWNSPSRLCGVLPVLYSHTDEGRQTTTFYGIPGTAHPEHMDMRPPPSVVHRSVRPTGAEVLITTCQLAKSE
jgi:hypothetical protein